MDVDEHGKIINEEYEGPRYTTRELFTIGISPGQFIGWQSLACSMNETNCVVSSLSFLGFIPKEKYKEVTEWQRLSKTGNSVEEILNFLAYINDVNEIVLFDTKDIFTDAIGNLPPGHGTIAAFTRLGGMGHAVVLARNTQGNLVILDTQTQKYYSGNENINNFIKEQNFYSVLLPYKYSTEKWLGKRKFTEYNMFSNALSKLKIQEEPSAKRIRTVNAIGGKKNKKRRTKKSKKLKQSVRRKK